MDNLLLPSSKLTEYLPHFLSTQPYTAEAAISSAPSFVQIILILSGLAASTGIMHLFHFNCCTSNRFLILFFHGSMSSDGIGSSHPIPLYCFIAIFWSAFIGSVLPARSQCSITFLSSTLFVHSFCLGHTASRSALVNTGSLLGSLIPLHFL